MHCIVITRNGSGTAWRFSNLRFARLHPIPQFDDVFADSPEKLVGQYGKWHIHDLLRFTEGRDKARLIDAIESWKDKGGFAPDAVDLIWHKVYNAAILPPEDPAEIVRIIKEDRLYREDRILRSIGSEEWSSSNSTRRSRKENDMTEEAQAQARKRVNEYDTITITTEEGKNPKNPKSKAFGRFAHYEDGITVKEAKARGVTATDITYDVAHNFISLTPGEAPAAAEGEAAEGEGEAPAKKSRGRAA